MDETKNIPSAPIPPPVKSIREGHRPEYILTPTEMEKQAEELLDKHAKIHMIEWSQSSFKRTHTRLHKSIIGAIVDANTQMVEDKNKIEKLEKQVEFLTKAGLNLVEEKKQLSFENNKLKEENKNLINNSK